MKFSSVVDNVNCHRMKLETIWVTRKCFDFIDLQTNYFCFNINRWKWVLSTFIHNIMHCVPCSCRLYSVYRIIYVAAMRLVIALWDEESVKLLQHHSLQIVQSGSMRQCVYVCNMCTLCFNILIERMRSMWLQSYWKINGDVRILRSKG